MLNPGMIARCSAWPVVLCYAAAIALGLTYRCERSLRWIRGLWTVGWLALVVHIGLAWWLFHGASWRAAYEHTAQQTELAIGWKWGGGVWFNLLTSVVWGIDLAVLWRTPLGVRRGTSWWDRACQGYLAFMIFNATVVFGSLPVQVAGGVICVGLGFAAVLGRCATSSPGS